MQTTNLEQSKKLKELGAPQIADNIESWWTTYEENNHLIHCTQVLGLLSGVSRDRLIAAYTLDEMIEWLGSTIHFVLYQDQFEWLAGDYYSGYPESPSEWTVKMSGSTPLEAVYNLCIALRESGTSLNTEE